MVQKVSVKLIAIAKVPPLISILVQRSPSPSSKPFRASLGPIYNIWQRVLKDLLRVKSPKGLTTIFY